MDTILCDGMDFNPRSREGSDESCSSNQQPVAISIHAPARGATEHLFGNKSAIAISIHAPARGATRSSILHCRGVKFQSTLPRGERRIWGREISPDKRNFNPRSREGSDSVNFV